MSVDLLAEVVSTLRGQNVPFALIGAAAMAADIQQLLLLDRAAVLLEDVDARVEALPSRSQSLWRELRDVTKREGS